MSLWSDDRAAAIQVGAIMLFAFAIIAMTAYQASVVPNQNKEIEFNHNQRVQGQLQDLEGTVGSAPAAGGTKTVVVDLSTTYPARSIFINPPNPTGTIQTVGTGDPAVSFTVQNASATGETGDFWNGTPRNYSTGAVAYRPNYNVYTQAPVSFVENSLVANQFADHTLVRNAQSLFDGKRIALVAVNGSYRENGGSASVAVRPVSASTNTVPVTDTGGDPVTITITSRLSAAKWKAVLNETGDFDPDGNDSNAYVSAVENRSAVTLPNGEKANRIAFVLEPGETYSLQLAKVGIGTNVAVPDGGAYVTRASPKNTSTSTGSTQTVTVEVRDEYNNPQAGVPMNATIESGSGNIKENNGTKTDEDGRVTFTYEAPNSKTTARINVSISKRNSKATSAVFNVSVTESSGGGGNGAYNVSWYNPADSAPSGTAQVTCSDAPPNGQCTIDANGESTVDLPLIMYTDPIADGASVTYSVSNTTVGLLSPTTGETNSTGENETTLAVDRNGTITTYVTSGAGGDRVAFTVEGIAGGESAPVATILSVTDKSTDCDRNQGGNCRGGSSPTAEFDVDWEATDSDGDLTNVTVQLVHQGSVVDSREYSYANVSSASNITTLTHDPGTWQGTYEIVVIATDDNGNSDSDSETETADGN